MVRKPTSLGAVALLYCAGAVSAIKPTPASSTMTHMTQSTSSHCSMTTGYEYVVSCTESKAKAPKTSAADACKTVAVITSACNLKPVTSTTMVSACAPSIMSSASSVNKAHATPIVTVADCKIVPLDFYVDDTTKPSDLTVSHFGPMFADTKGQAPKGPPAKGQPTKGQPTKGQPTKGQTTAKSSSTTKPATTKSTSTKPKPTTTKPATTKPKPTTKKPATTKPKPTTAKPTTAKPTTAKPTTLKPTASTSSKCSMTTGYEYVVTCTENKAKAPKTTAADACETVAVITSACNLKPVTSTTMVPASKPKPTTTKPGSMRPAFFTMPKQPAIRGRPTRKPTTTEPKPTTSTASDTSIALTPSDTPTASVPLPVSSYSSAAPLPTATWGLTMYDTDCASLETATDFNYYVLEGYTTPLTNYQCSNVQGALPRNSKDSESCAFFSNGGLDGPNDCSSGTFTSAKSFVIRNGFCEVHADADCKDGTSGGVNSMQFAGCTNVGDASLEFDWNSVSCFANPA